LFNRSAKASFKAKLLSSVSDYAARYDLLQFQHDMYIYRTVTSTKNISKRHRIGHANALADKTWVSKYWDWAHAGLIDIVEQLGTPDVCYTIAPYEFLFTWPQWLQDLKVKLGRGDMQLPALETIHMVHALRQLVVGFLAGSNGTKPTIWREHVFSDKTNPSRSAVLCFWARIELQEGSKNLKYHGRGSPHVHVLWWFKDVRVLGLERSLRGHLNVEDDPVLAALATQVQQSHKPSKAIREEATTTLWSSQSQRYVVLAQYTKSMAEAATMRAGNLIRKPLRIFLAPLLRVCHCHQDWTSVTPDDNNAPLMTYMAGYVSKMHKPMDHLLKGADTDWEAGHRVVSGYQPMEPQMVLDLASIPVTWTSATTKRVVIRRPDEQESWELEQYRLRDFLGSVPIMENRVEMLIPYKELSFLQWCRTHTRDKKSNTAKRMEKKLVAVQVVLAPVQSDDFFGQWLTLHMPHQCVEELMHPRHKDIPENYKWVAAAGHWRPQVWRDGVAMRKLFELRGHKHDYAVELSEQILADLRFVDMMLQGALPGAYSCQLPCAETVRVEDLSVSQRLVYFRVAKQLAIRKKYRFDDCEDELAWVSDLDDEQATFVHGGPGAGKSTVAIAIAKLAISMGLKVRMSFPAARLQNEFASKVPEATMGTVHSHYGIGYRSGDEDSWVVKEGPQEDDLLVIDELSRLPENMVDHILRTRVEARNWPVLLFLGDFSQVGAIGRGNALTSEAFRRRVHRINLQGGSKRAKDPQLLEFLDAIRNAVPTPRLLQSISNGRVLANKFDTGLLERLFDPAKADYPTVLTVTNNGSDEVNAMVLQFLGAGQTSARRIPVFDRNFKVQELLIFPGARVMITQNKDIVKGIVNGHMALVIHVCESNLILELADKRRCSLTLTRVRKGKVLLQAFSLAGGYAMTIHKSQGLTMRKAIIYWNSPCAQPGLGYTGVSRVRTLADLAFIGQPSLKHFVPVCN
jgi:AAA domain